MIALPTLPTFPTLHTLPKLIDLPTLPTLPTFPTLPTLPTLPRSHRSTPRSTLPYLPLLLLLLLGGSTVAERPPATQTKPTGYAFQYGVRDDASGTLYAHTESRNGITTTGQYTVHLPDGRIQTVKYTADHNGYRATVKYDGVAKHPEKFVAPHNSRPLNFPEVVANQKVPIITAIPVKSHFKNTQTKTTPSVLPAHSSDSEQPIIVFKPIRPTLDTVSIIPKPTVVPLNSLPPLSSTVPDPKPLIIDNTPKVPQPSVVPSHSLQPQPFIVHILNQSIPDTIPRVPHPPGIQLQSTPQFSVPFPNVPRVPHPHALSSHSTKPQLQIFTVPFPSQPIRPSSQIFTVPFPNQPINNVLAAQSFRPSHQFNQSPTVQTNTRLPPSVGSFVPQAHSLPSNSIPASNKINFVDFYKLPSVPSRNKQRVIPANTFIPSASIPGVSSEFNFGSVQEIEDKTPNLQQNIHTSVDTNSLTKLQPPYYSTSDLNTISKPTIPTRLMPPYQDETPGVTYQKLTPYLSLPDKQESYNNNGIGYLPVSAQEVSNTGYSNNQHVPQSSGSNGYLPSNSITNSFDGSNSSEENIATIQNIISSYSSTNEEKKTTTRFIPVPPSEQVKLPFRRRPYIIDPDASVFHDQPSIIVDYKHRGSSHEEDDEKVPLTAPYVLVAGTYSSNPVALFTVNNVQPRQDPNSVANHGIAPPDAADTGNVRLSSASLPPHLAKLQNHDEIGRKSPTPLPVQIKLGKHRNLPLRNQPSTFGGNEHEFSPNSFVENEKRNREKRSSTNISSYKKLLLIPNKYHKLDNHHRKARSTPYQTRNTFDSALSFTRIRKTELRPLIRNG